VTRLSGGVGERREPRGFFLCRIGPIIGSMMAFDGKNPEIRQKVIDRAYYLSSHAEEEMLDDELRRDDVENAILKGRIEKKLSEDIRGIRYRIEGPAKDGRLIHVICRFREDTNLIIITVYALPENL